MTRFASPGNANALTQVHIPYVLFAMFDFVSGKIFANSGDQQYVWSAPLLGTQIWLPLGTLGQVSDVTETSDLTSQQLTFTLSGVDNSLIITTLGENYHNRDVQLYVGYVDPDTGALIAVPELLWEGFMDTMTVDTNQNTSNIIMVCENRLVRWALCSGWLNTQEHQRLFDPMDNFFDQLSTLQGLSTKWGDSPLLYSGHGSATTSTTPSNAGNWPFPNAKAPASGGNPIN
jgi:hypothetical protein